MKTKYTLIALAAATTLSQLPAFAADEADIQRAIEYVKQHEKDGSVKTNGLGLISADGESSINLTGMVHFDAHVFNSNLPKSTDKDSASAADQFEFRRVRLGVNGTMFKDIDYELIVNATGTDTNILDTGFLNFSANKDAQIRVGRFRQPYSLEAMTKDASIDFLERSYGDQNGPNKLLGAMVWGEPRKGFTYGVAIAQAGFNEITNSINIGVLGTGRVTLNFGELNNLDGQVVHFGLSTNGGKYQVTPTITTDTGTALSDGTSRATLLTYRTESRGLSNAYRVQLTGETIGTGYTYGSAANDAADVKKQLNDLEFAYANGPFKYQAELAKLTLSGSALTGTAATSTTYSSLVIESTTTYQEVVYNLTGEKWSDAYKAGAFTGIKPLSNYQFGKGGTGAWQLALRYSSYTGNYVGASGTNNTIKTTATGGRASNSEGANTITYGVNWLLNPNTVIKMNYAVTKFDRNVGILSSTASGTASTENAFSIRAQINF